MGCPLSFLGAIDFAAVGCQSTAERRDWGVIKLFNEIMLKGVWCNPWMALTKKSIALESALVVQFNRAETRVPLRIIKVLKVLLNDACSSSNFSNGQSRETCPGKSKLIVVERPKR